MGLRCLNLHEEKSTFLLFFFYILQFSVFFKIMNCKVLPALSSDTYSSGVIFFCLFLILYSRQRARKKSYKTSFGTLFQTQTERHTFNYYKAAYYTICKTNQLHTNPCWHNVACHPYIQCIYGVIFHIEHPYQWNMIPKETIMHIPHMNIFRTN